MPAAVLLLLMFGWFALDQLLLWQFLGLQSPVLAIMGTTIFVLIGWHISKAAANLPDVPLIRLGLCLSFALLLFALGGEGRFFYANIDWQVRDAVLRDMAINPWPFVYVTDAKQPDLLRAPIGMFLVPALAFKAWGARAGDMVLLLQNSLLLASILSLGAHLFAATSQRVIALLVVTFFSGLDLIGQLIFHGRPEDHLEFWFDWLQFSSHITQAFWVPQHGLAGWTAALLFLLWQRDQLPLWIMLSILPLTALWSPLALIGAMPFVLYAAAQTIQNRSLSVADFGWPSLICWAVLPSLVYLGAAGDGVGIRLYSVPLASYIVFMGLELLVWLLPLKNYAESNLQAKVNGSLFSYSVLAIVTLVLVLCPFVQIGWSLDFMMRASIPSLAILSVLVADAILRSSTCSGLRVWLVLMAIVGSATGLSEVARAISQPSSPRGVCSFFGAWDQNFAHYPKGSYLAPLDHVPELIRPQNPSWVRVADPPICWKGAWLRPSGV